MKKEQYNNAYSTARKSTITNFERIKNMNIKELAVLLADEIPHGDCYGCEQMCHHQQQPYRLRDCCQDGWLEWLEREVAR